MINRICPYCFRPEGEVKFKSKYNRKCNVCYEEKSMANRKEARELANAYLAPINLNTTDIRLRWLKAMDKKKEGDIWESLTDIPDLILALDSARDTLKHVEEWVKSKETGINKPVRQIAEQWWQRRKKSDDEADFQSEGYKVAM